MRVVHCKREPFTHYIGRGRGSSLGNPFSHKPNTNARFKVDTIEEALMKYEEYLRSRPELLYEIKMLPADAVLGCWCKFTGSEPCHGDVIVRLWKELNVTSNNY